MNVNSELAAVPARAEIAALVERLRDTEQQLEALLGDAGQSAAERGRRASLMRRARQALRERGPVDSGGVGGVLRRERMFSTMLASIGDLAHAYDRDCRFIYANQPLLEQWNLTIDQVVGKSFSELGYPAELAERLRGEVQQVFDRGREGHWRRVLHRSRPGARRVRNHLRASPWARRFGRVRGRLQPQHHAKQAG